VTPLSDDETDLLVLFFRNECELCHEAIDLVREVKGARIALYEVFQARIDGMIEMRPRNGVRPKKPLLIKADLLDAVPCLYDPLEDEFIPGLEEIREYLTQSGLIS
jgi:hypothetical protein